MAYATIAVTTLVRPEPSNSANNVAGAAVTPGAGNGVKFANDGHTFLLCLASGLVGAANIVTSAVAYGLALADIAGAVVAAVGTNNGVTLLGPFSPALYNDSAGLCQVEFASGGALTVWAFTMPI